MQQSTSFYAQRNNSDHYEQTNNIAWPVGIHRIRSTTIARKSRRSVSPPSAKLCVSDRSAAAAVQPPEEGRPCAVLRCVLVCVRYRVTISTLSRRAHFGPHIRVNIFVWVRV